MGTHWLSRMHADPQTWLRGHEDPMVRYRALVWIEERLPTDPAVQEARREAARHPRLDALLAGQGPNGEWGNPEHFARDDYHGTVWRLCLAAQLGAERTEAVHRAVQFLFEAAQCREGGGFSEEGSRARGGTIGSQRACLTGAVVEMLVHFGYGSDTRTERALGFLVSRQQADGLYPCRNFSPNEGTLPLRCYMGSVKPVLAALSLSAERRTPELRSLCARTAESLLTFGLHRYKRAPDGRAASKTSWFDFGFPRFWDTDLLEVAWILTRMGYVGHPALEDAFRIILDKQLKNGRWRLDVDYHGRLPIPLGKTGISDPWITLRATHTLKLASPRRELVPA